MKYERTVASQYERMCRCKRFQKHNYHSCPKHYFVPNYQIVKYVSSVWICLLSVFVSQFRRNNPNSNSQGTKVGSSQKGTNPNSLHSTPRQKRFHLPPSIPPDPYQGKLRWIGLNKHMNVLASIYTNTQYIMKHNIRYTSPCLNSLNIHLTTISNNFKRKSTYIKVS